MATIASTSDHSGRRAVVTWETVTTGDVGASWAMEGDGSGLCAVQITGTFNGGTTAVMQVSNDGVTWFTADDVQGTAVSATADAFFEMSTAARYIRPSVSSGSSDDLDVVLVIRRASR